MIKMLLIGGLGVGEIALIVLVVLLFFGASRIPALFRSVGSGVKAFRDGVEGKAEESDEKPKEEK